MDRFVRHKRIHNKQCRSCREFYNDTIKLTSKIRNKNLKEELLGLWNTLWLNGCNDFDIILYELDWEVLRCQPMQKRKQR